MSGMTMKLRENRRRRWRECGLKNATRTGSAAEVAPRSGGRASCGSIAVKLRHISNNAQATLSNATSRTTLSTKSNVVSTRSNVASTLLPSLMWNEFFVKFCPFDKVKTN